MTKKFTFIK